MATTSSSDAYTESTRFLFLTVLLSINLYSQFSLVKLCDRESSCDIRRDCCHHFVTERDMLWARCSTSLPSRKVSVESLCRDEKKELRWTSNEQCIMTSGFLLPITSLLSNPAAWALLVVIYTFAGKAKTSSVSGSI